jgi:hypothetical protein
MNLSTQMMKQNVKAQNTAPRSPFRHYSRALPNIIQGVAFEGSNVDCHSCVELGYSLILGLPELVLWGSIAS